MPEITATQESALAQRLKSLQQDKKVPLLININDGRLMPNVQNIALDPNYRPYRGDPKAPLDKRMAYVRQMGAFHRQVINSAADELPEEKPPVDIGKLSKEELIAFAFDEYTLPLDPATDIRTMRKMVMAAAEDKAAKAESDIAG